MAPPSSTDAVVEFCVAARKKDVEAMIGSLAPDAELISPIFRRAVFRGHDDLRVILSAAFGGLTGLHFYEIVGDDRTRVALSDARIVGIAISDAMVVELDEAGQIRRIRPHLRPWLALTILALTLGPKLARHPAVVRRALKTTASQRVPVSSERDKGSSRHDL